MILDNATLDKKLDEQTIDECFLIHLKNKIYYLEVIEDVEYEKEFINYNRLKDKVKG